MQWHRKLQKKERDETLYTLWKRTPNRKRCYKLHGTVLHVMKSTAKVWRSTLFGSYSFDYYPRYCCTWVESLYQKPPANSFPMPIVMPFYRLFSWLHRNVFWQAKALWEDPYCAAYCAAFLSAHCGKLLYSDKKLRSLSGLIILVVSNLVLSWMFYS